MPEKPINNLQDKLFKEIFRRSDAAIGFFKSYLPQDLVAKIDWETLELASGSFVDEQWRDRFSDLVFNVHAGLDALKLYLLFEHQSTPEPFMAVRFLSYKLNLWEQMRAANPKIELLPQVIPVLLYQGKTPWKYGNQLANVLNTSPAIEDVIEPFTGNFEYIVVDLPQLNTDDIKGHIIGQVAMILMKSYRDGRIWNALTEIEPMLLEICQADDTAGLIRRFFSYIFESDSRVDKQAYYDKIMLLNDEQLQETAMSIADILRKEGKEEGLQEGMEIGTLIGRIQGYQELLGNPVDSKEILQLISADELDFLYEQLKGEVHRKLNL